MNRPLDRLRRTASRAFVRSRVVRRAASVGYYRSQKARPYDLGHLSLFGDQESVGPLQRDEALLLFALARMTRPQVIVEMGFLYGRSALNFLVALPAGAHLHSFDVTEEAAHVARAQFSDLPNFSFHLVSQADITAQHVGGRPIDLVLLDASHDLELNKRTFERLQALLSPTAILAVHDTGTWRRQAMRDIHHDHARGVEGGWLNADDFQHQPDERRFVNWILQDQRDWSVLHLHATATLRHGLTLVQRRAPLQVDPAPPRLPVGLRHA